MKRPSRRALKISRRLRRLLGLPHQPLRNVLGSDHPRRALLSYLEAPCLSVGKQVRHTNALESLAWARALDGLGFVVDVIDFRTRGMSLAGYDLICGFGEPLEESIAKTPPLAPPKVFYGPGCSPLYTNHGSAERVFDLFQRHGLWHPEAGRFNPLAWPLQVTLSDAYVILGVAFSEKTFRDYRVAGEVHGLSGFHLKPPQGLPEIEKDFAAAAQNVLWFGSDGIVHKGLDLVFEAARRLPDTTFHICGVRAHEQGLARELSAGLDNVRHHGFVDPGSAAFAEVMRACGIVLMPSASEGGAASVLTAVANGALVAIVSEACSLDLGGAEVLLPEISAEALLGELRRVQGWDPAVREARGRAGRAHCLAHASFEVYERRLGEILADLVGRWREGAEQGPEGGRPRGSLGRP